MAPVSNDNHALYQITTPRFVAGLTVDPNGVISSVAPIIRWMLGQRIDNIRSYCSRMRYKIIRVSP